ncbi:MAG: hypothetical protein QXG00_01560 [Candidatus Woesearchaeota archaeon]
MVKAKKAYKCPHCKKKIYIEDLEAIEDTAALQGSIKNKISLTGL